MSGIDFAAIGARAAAVSPGAFTSRDTETEPPRDIRGMGLPYEPGDGEEVWRTAVSAQPGTVARQAAGDLGEFPVAVRSSRQVLLDRLEEDRVWMARYLRRHPGAEVTAARARERARRQRDAEEAAELARSAAYDETGAGWPEITRAYDASGQMLVR